MSKYPLKWPIHWPRCKSPGKSQFKTSLAGALKNVENELRLFSKDSGSAPDAQKMAEINAAYDQAKKAKA